jgi:hypothetical protein
MSQVYTFKDIFLLCIYKIKTKFIFRNARLIRFPFRLRGKRYIEINEGFTTGYNCRIDAFNINKNNNVLISIGKMYKSMMMFI